MKIIVSHVVALSNNRVIGNMPHTLKLIQNSSVCVLHTNSFRIAKKTKKEAHLNISLSQPISSNLIEPPKNN